MSRDIIEAIDRQSATLRRFYALPDAVLEFHYEGLPVKMFIPDADRDLVQNHILLHRSFYELPALVACRARFGLTGATILDIGANIGNHAVFYGAVCKVGRCIAVEPNPYAASILDRNIRLNDLSQTITVRPEAVSSKAGAMRFDCHQPDNLGGTSFRAADDGPIRAIALDQLEPSAVDFIKIDVEGTVCDVLTGAKETLSNFRPPLFIEIWPKEMPAAETILKSIGYRRTESLGDDNYFYEHG